MAVARRYIDINVNILILNLIQLEFDPYLRWKLSLLLSVTYIPFGDNLDLFMILNTTKGLSDNLEKLYMYSSILK